MRVLHLTRDFPPRSTGGLSTAVGGLVGAAAAAGVDSAVLSFDDWRPRGGDPTSAPAPAPLERDAASGAAVCRVRSPAQLDQARAFATGAGADLVVVHHDLLWELGAELAAALAIPAATFVHVVHAEQDRLRRAERPSQSAAAQARALADADLVIAPSRAAGALVAEQAGARLRIARLGVAPAPTAGAAIARDPHALLFAGRFSDITGTAELFAAIPRIVAAEPRARVAIAGGLPANARAERRWRRRWDESATAGAAARTEILGWLARDALFERYRRAAIVLAPSHLETFGQVVAEAMLAGCAVVATTAGALPELVEHEVTGVLVPPRDAAALADAAVALLADPERRARLGKAAERAAGEATWPRRVGEHLACYRELVAGR